MNHFGGIMTKTYFYLAALLTILILPLSANATYIDSQNIYQIGNTTNGPVTLSWNHFYDGSASPAADASLTIVAEGIDFAFTGLQENDRVFFNGHLLGELTQQNFYFGGFDIQAGPGALGAPTTALTTSIFAIDLSWLMLGNNHVEIEVDPQTWIMEAETSKLTVNAAPVPEPSTMLLLGSGLLGIGFYRRKSKK